MNSTKRTLGTVIMALGIAGTAVAQPNVIIPPARIGLYGGLGLDGNSPSIQAWRTPLPNNPNILSFRNDTVRIKDGSTGLSGAFGIMGGFPITRTIHFTGRLGYNNVNGSAELVERHVDTTLTHKLSGSVGLLEVTPAVEFYDLLPVSIHGIVGLEFGIPLSSSMTQDATISASGFEGTQRLSGPDKIPNTTVRAALMLGAGYTLKLSEKWYLQPEISYRIPLTNVSSEVAYSPWKFSQLRLGVNIFFDISPDPEGKPAARNGISASMEKIVAFDPDGKEYPVSVVNVEDVRYNEMFPLVPYVFCAENQTQPDTTLQRTNISTEQGEFIPESLPLDAVEVNRNLLNIIGTRMQKYPQASLTITGTTDGKTEAKARELARQRADFAKDYLVKRFNISADRITTNTTATPAKSSSNLDPDGIAENRRIEFSSNVPDVLAPVVITADNQRVATPDVIAFHPKVESEDSLKSWSLRISQAGRPLRDLNGKGRPMAISWAIRPNELSAAQVPVDYEFYAADADGDTAVVSGSLPVEYVSSVRKRTENLPDRTVDKYSLILFDFDKATLNEDNARILEQMVLPSIKSNSRVSIIGYTDRIGNDEYNRKLSKERAETVKTFLSSKAKDAKYTSSGVGESSQIFSNDLPIGRQLSRTVQVIVETPRR